MWQRVTVESKPDMYVQVSHKSRNAIDKYPQIRYSATHVHFSVKNNALWNMCLMHCGIHVTCLLSRYSGYGTLT